MFSYGTRFMKNNIEQQNTQYKMSRLAQNTLQLSETIKKFGFSIRFLQYKTIQYMRAFQTRQSVPPFVCGTINKESLNFYNYNIDEFLYNGLQRDKNE